MTALTQDVVADLRRRIAELEQRLQSSLGERDEAIAQQAATAEVLQVINASPGDLAPVFDAIVEKALRLCDADGGALWLVDGDMARATGRRGGKMAEPFSEYVGEESVPVKYLLGSAQDRPFVHVIDLKTTKPYQDGVPFFVANVELGGVRTNLSVPLNEAGRIIGIFPHSPGGAAVHRQADRTRAKLCRSGANCDEERGAPERLAHHPRSSGRQRRNPPRHRQHAG